MNSLASCASAQYLPLATALDNILHDEDGASLVKVLSTYQNDDGGFGHGLEADIQMPQSNIASTNMAMNLLRFVHHPSKFPMIQKAIRYYESVYDPVHRAFDIVPPEVDQYPHAIWWNYDSIGSFTYGNPNPEIAGTLLQYKQYVTSMDVEQFVQAVEEYIVTDMNKELSMHSLLSTLWFYQRSNDSIRQRFYPVLSSYVARLVDLDPVSWEGYSLEPYKIYLIAPDLIEPYQDALRDNLSYLQQKLGDTLLQPAWQWGQYDDVFAQVKEQWALLMTFDVRYAIHQFGKQ